MINLISDTVTRPTPPMREIMMAAEVGDDVFREDPTVNALEEYTAQLVGMEAALFCPSGTMTNQIAIKLHTQALDEVICESQAHIYHYETGAWAMQSGVSIRLVAGTDGIMDCAGLAEAIRPSYDWVPRTRLVTLENTCNKAGGTYYTLKDIAPLHAFCRTNKLALHLDGARLWNAIAVSGDDLESYGRFFDTISLCLSKGLGAPVGSLLVGSTEAIREARRIRKAMGGGMRQAGFLAAAGLYALQHHRDRIVLDHTHARLIGDTLSECAWVSHIRPVQTNIIIFDIDANWGTAEQFVAVLHKHNIRVSAFGPQTIRIVTHLDVSATDCAHVCEILRNKI